MASVNSALQRARATLATRDLTASHKPLPEAQQKLVAEYVEAFLRYDVDKLVSLLSDEATLSMPPFTLWLKGREHIREWLLGRGIGCKGSTLVPTAACGLPAFGQYRVNPEGGYKPWSLIVLELEGEKVKAWNAFLDTERLFPMFGLPASLPAR